MKLNIIFKIPLLAAVIFSSCLNKYETDIIGTYNVGKYELADSVKTIPNDLPILNLKKDKTFLLSFKDKNVAGKWNADDYGDWTMVNFFFDGNNIQGQIGTNEIRILNPNQFECPFLKTLEFTRINK